MKISYVVYRAQELLKLLLGQVFISKLKQLFCNVRLENILSFFDVHAKIVYLCLKEMHLFG